MAKGNMLQGMARGKVGDVVFSRLNGQQISRVRNRQPYNPRTNKQLIQRAIMATVMLGYSAGKEIFNHSFQGKRWCRERVYASTLRLFAHLTTLTTSVRTGRCWPGATAFPVYHFKGSILDFLQCSNRFRSKGNTRPDVGLPGHIRTWPSSGHSTHAGNSP